MKLIKKIQQEQKIYFFVINDDQEEVEIVTDSKGNILSLGVKDDVQISPEDMPKSKLDKYQEFCTTNLE